MRLKLNAPKVHPRQSRFIAILVTLFLLSASALAQNAVVRVNQLGYVTGASKRAYLMSKGTESGASFSLNSGSSSVFSAPIGADLGAWGTYLHVYALDFDSVSTAGTYTIAVTGPTAATSPGFKIDTGTNIYGSALANTLSYYQNSRDGANFIASTLRTAAGHLNDQHAGVYNTPTYDSSDNITSGPNATGATVDASGGWFDAGDYIKFVETHSYTVAMMGIGVRDFPNQMGAGSSQSNFTNEFKFGLDWLQKMWDDNSKTLYYQVGIGTGNSSIVSDHDIWRLPQDDDTWGGTDPTTRFIRNRPVLINTAGGAGAKISPNMAGRLAADFAVCYQVFKISNPAYANQCLLSAEHVFDLANTSPSGNLLTVAPFDFYGETEWRDDLELGATELYLALQPGNLPSGLPHTDPNFYLTAAANWANAYMTGPGDAGDTLNLYDVSGLAHYELYRALKIAGNPSGLAVNQASVLADFQKELNNATSIGSKDPFGFGFSWATDDTASHGGGLSVMASEYGALTGTNTHAAHAERWLDNVLGANAWGISLMVGDGLVFPDCIQHQIANLLGSLSGGSPVLSGAVVEGPNSKGTSGSLTNMKACDQSARFTPFNGNGAVYVDNVQSYNTTEPAIDLTASSALAMAWQMANSGTPTPDFSLAAAPGSATVTAANSASYTASVTALNGFSGSVSLAVSGLPTGATAAFSPTSVSGSGTSTLAVSTVSTTPPGNYTLTIAGTSGSLSHSATVTLSVNAPPDFALSATPGSQTIVAGNSGTYTANITPSNGFSGSVALSVSGVPAGATASFNPTSVTGSGSSTLTVATGTAANGTYTLTISGTSGSLNHSATVTLTISSQPVPDFSLSATPGSQGVTTGNNASYTASISAINGFSGSVALSVSGVPAGATASFNPASVTGSGSSTLTVATGTAAVGTYPLTITGTSGSLSHSASVTLMINPVNNTPVYQINSGGPAVSPFAADAFFSGGQIDTVTTAINTSGVTNPAPMAVYQSERWGGDANSNPAPFSYTFPNLTAGASYTVRLHFAEIFWTAAGQRIFNVAINGTPVLSNFDIVAAAGAANKAIVEQFTTTATSTGTIAISFTVGTADAPKISGIEIIPAAPPAPDFTLGATPASQNVVAGNSTSYTATVTAVNGFNGSVALSVSGVPAGATASFNPASVSGAGTSTLTVAGGTAAAGTYPLTITGTSGTLTHSAGVTLVISPQPVPDFTLAAAPGSQTVTAGNSAGYTATVTAVNGFSGSVALSVSGLPTGASASFSPASVSGSGTSTLSVASGTAAAGTYPLTITGSSGSLTHSATVTLVIKPVASQCLTSGTTWQNTALPAVQTGTFTVTFDATPAATGINSVIALSNGAQSAYTGFATLVAFNAAGIQARNGGTYAPPSPISYAAGVTYHIREVVNVPAHTYSIFVTAPGGSEQTVGSNFNFRTEQNTVTSLDNWGLFASSGSLTVCNFTVGIPAPDFTLGASPSTVTVTAGNSGSYTVNLGALNSFSGSVGLSVSGVPAGATASFTPASVTGSGSSALTVATGTAAPGTYPLTITGSSGSLTHSTSVTLTINPQPVPDFTLGATPNTVTVTAGNSASYTTTVTAINSFSGSVSLSASGLPSGATASFSPTSVTGSGSSTLTVATGTAATGTYTLTVTGTSGSLTHSASVTLTINPQPVPDFTLSATPGSQTVTAGNSTTYTASVSAINGFSGSVGFSVSGVPSGATASFSPASVTGSGSSTLTVNTGTVAAATYTLTITGTSGSLTHSAIVTLVINPVVTQCVTTTAGGAWQNTAFANQTGTFTVQFDASASVSPANAVVGLSNGAQTAYTGFAAIARFNPSGDIDARNAGAYAADNVIPYSAGVTYHFREVINIPAHTYSVFVTAPGGTEQTVGSNFMFRTEQNTVSQLNWWGAFSSVGSETACNFTLGTSGGTPDFSLAATPASQSVTPGSSATYTATVSAVGGFNGSVALSVSGVPSGATASFSPTSVSGAGSSTLTVATGTAAAGTYTLTITGTSGSLTHTAAVTLTIGTQTASKFFAPYIDMSISSNLPQVSSTSGIKFFTLAFIIDGGGCTPSWGGLGPVSGENTFAGYISSLRASGGDVVISFGGASGSELAQVCTSVASLQAAYQSVINKYNVKMLDFDIEGAAVGDPTSIDRRSQALANLAKANPGLVISLTLPVNPTGLDNNGIGVVQSAVTFGVPVSVVTIMAMDYGGADSHMGTDATMAATDTISQLQSAGLNANVGIIPMIGQNDTSGEIFTLADAQTVMSYAQSNSNITRLSFWSVTRDNGGCAGNTTASDTCSGVSQSNWAFSHIFEPF